VADGVTPAISYVGTTKPSTGRLASCQSSKRSPFPLYFSAHLWILGLRLAASRPAEVARRFVEMTASTGIAPVHHVLVVKDAEGEEKSGRSACTVMYRSEIETGCL